MLGLFSPRCPLTPKEQVCVERGMARLVETIGVEWIRRTPVLTSADLQDVLSVEPVAAADIADRFTPQFPFPVDGLEWLEEPDIQGQIAVEYVPGDPPTAVVPHQPRQSPELRAAHVARCLCQHALRTRPEFADIDRQSMASVDLLAVLTGIGIFPANTTFASKYGLDLLMESWQHWKQPFLPSRLFGYALAVRGLLSEEPNAPCSSELRLDAREPFDLGRKYLRKRRPVVWDETRDMLRSFRSPPPAESVVRRLCHRSPAEQINALYDVAEYQITDEKCLTELSHLTHDASDEVRVEAIRTIALLDSDAPVLLEALVLFCEDRTPRVRALAARAIGDLEEPTPGMVSPLRELLNDREPIARSAAAEALLRFPQWAMTEQLRLFRILRQQLARCDYDGVDRFLRHLQTGFDDAAAIIRSEFSSAEEETWRMLLLQSLESANGEKPTPGHLQPPQADGSATERSL